MPPNDPDLPFHKSSINITIPHDGFAVRPGDDFTVRGTTTADPPVTVTAVKVQYGENAQFKPALKVTSNWSKWFLTNSVPTSGSHKITAQMSVQFGSQGTGTTKTTISVIGDETSPTLNITEVNPGNSVTGSGPNFPITLRGTASDAQGVSSVKIRVGTRVFQYQVKQSGNPTCYCGERAPIQLLWWRKTSLEILPERLWKLLLPILKGRF